MLRRALLVLAAQLPAAALAQGLGLAERRALLAYRTERWPEMEAAIHQAAGFAVPVQVEWDDLALPGRAADYAAPEFFGQTIFTPLTQALNSISRDPMGRTALREKLTRIVVRLDRATAPISNYPNGLSFADGVLTINWEPGTNVDDVAPRTAALVAVLERNL